MEKTDCKQVINNRNEIFRILAKIFLFMFNYYMMKIGTKIQNRIIRYETKNTVSAQYNRYLNRAKVSSLLTGIEVFRLPFWGVEDIGITSMLAVFSMKNIKEAWKMFNFLKPIKQRALAIKRAKTK